MISAYDEILDFVTSGPTLEAIVAFEHSPQTLERVRYLEAGEAEDGLDDAERFELREFRRATEFMEQLKIRARRRLTPQRPDRW